MRNKSHRLQITGATALVLLANVPAVTLAQETESLYEVIVTATKRKVDVRDVAGAVSAMTETDLQNLGAQSLSDYITRVPGVVFNDYQPGVSEVVIRGVASTTYHENNQTTVGYYINEVPLTEFGFPVGIPDIDTFDLQRVEILRGPQGTLYGSSSLGGLVNYVANEADASKFDTGIETSLASTRNAGEENYAVKGMVNVPIIDDKLAFRLVGLQRFDAGYLDAPLRNQQGVNDLTVRGLRGSLVWTPSDTTRLSYLGLYQEYDLEDQTYTITPSFNRFTEKAEPHETTVRIHSLRLEQDLGAVNLTAIGSQSEKTSKPTFDYTVFYPPDFRAGTPMQAFGDAESELNSIEVRLTSSDDDARVTWLVGANYTDSDRSGYDTQYQEGVSAYIDANPALFGGLPGSLLAPGDFFERIYYGGSTEEQAVFGEVAVKLADPLTLTLGGRYFEVTSDVYTELLINAALVDPYRYQPGDATETGFTPKVSLNYQFSDAVMAYALYSEGFRVGGANVNAAATANAPAAFDSDETANFEIGVRTSWADGRITADLAVYRIDWDNIQVRLFTSDFGLAYTSNGGGARIKGAEFSGVFNFNRYVNFSTAISYTDAELSELLPDTFLPSGGYPAGSTLPGASEWTLSNSLTVDIGEVRFNPVFSINHRYLTEAPVAFGAQLEKGDYHLVDMRLSFDINDQTQLTLFGKNVFDEYGILNAPFGDLEGAGSITRPRTFGATVRWNFN